MNDAVNRLGDGTHTIGDKVFENKPIFLPFELDKARSYINRPNRIVIGATGYSKISDQNLVDWQIREGDYEDACMKAVALIIREIQFKYQGCEVILVHGASDLGIDKAMVSLGRKLNLVQLGFSCPQYLGYCVDDDIPVFVAANREEYADQFVRNLDILISMNGREQALKHDIAAAIQYNKLLVLMNILKAISPVGGPPHHNPDGSVGDATAAFEYAIAAISSQGTPGGDLFMRMVEDAATAAVVRARSLLDRKIAYNF